MHSVVSIEEDKGAINKLSYHLRKNISISLPIVISQIGIMALGFTDTLMVGYLGAEDLAASGVANSVFFIITIIGLGTMSIVSTLVAAAQSQKDKRAINDLFWNAQKVSFGMGVATMLVLFILSLQFHWFGQDGGVEKKAREFLMIIAISAIPLMIFAAARNFTDGLSIMRPAMWCTFIAVFVNIFLNWILIHGKFGFPAWGLNGAGVATLLTRILIAFLLISYIFYHKYLRSLTIGLSLKDSSKKGVHKILLLGLPSGMQYFFEVAAFSGANIIIGWIGTKQLAAHQIAISLASITYMVALGIANGGSIRVGNAFGTKDWAQVKMVGNATFILAIGFMLMSCVSFLIFKLPLSQLYIDEEKVLDIATKLLIIAAFFQLFDGIQVVGLGVLRGVNDVHIPTGITLFAYWIVGLPLGYFLAIPLKLGAEGMWIGLSFGLIVSAALLSLRFYWICYNRSKK
jgi:multidrug resistance protein, MATE family